MPLDLPPGAIGHRDDFKLEDGSPDYEALAGKHIDGQTGLVFESEEAYTAFVNQEEVEE